jgi:hypothetical protein
MIRAKGGAGSIRAARSILKNGSFHRRNDISNQIYRFAKYSFEYIVRPAPGKIAFVDIGYVQRHRCARLAAAIGFR